MLSYTFRNTPWLALQSTRRAYRALVARIELRRLGRVKREGRFLHDIDSIKHAVPSDTRPRQMAMLTAVN